MYIGTHFFKIHILFVSNKQTKSMNFRYRRLTKTKKKNSIPHIYLCTTMWHENEQEMTQILTSLMR